MYELALWGELALEGFGLAGALVLGVLSGAVIYDSVKKIIAPAGPQNGIKIKGPTVKQSDHNMWTHPGSTPTTKADPVKSTVVNWPKEPPSTVSEKPPMTVFPTVELDLGVPGGPKVVNDGFGSVSRPVFKTNDVKKADRNDKI
jgi:hypothetical protein